MSVHNVSIIFTAQMPLCAYCHASASSIPSVHVPLTQNAWSFKIASFIHKRMNQTTLTGRPCVNKIVPDQPALRGGF